MRNGFVVGLALATLAATNCATRSASIDQRMILPDSGDRYAMEDRQLFLMPMSLGNEPPEFPAALQLNDLAPTTVCAEITISDAGRVEHVAPLHETGDCGTGVQQQVAGLQQVVESRLRQWRFEPAAICTFRDAQAAVDANGVCRDGDAERKPVAVRLAYAFTFEVRNGKRRVSGNRVDGH